MWVLEPKKKWIHVRVYLLETKTIRNSKARHRKEDTWCKWCVCCLVHLCISEQFGLSHYLILAVGHMSLASEAKIITYLGIYVTGINTSIYTQGVHFSQLNYGNCTFPTDSFSNFRRCGSICFPFFLLLILLFHLWLYFDYIYIFSKPFCNATCLFQLRWFILCTQNFTWVSISHFIWDFLYLVIAIRAVDTA